MDYLKYAPYKDQIFVHRKSQRRVKVTNEPRGHWDHMDLLYLDQDGPIRKGRKKACYFDYDYVPEEKETKGAA